MTNLKTWRQGDVFIIATDAIPESAKPVKPEADGAIVLALGEVTGHKHAFYGGGVKMFRDDGAGSAQRTFISIGGSDVAELQHEEHNTIPLAPGSYEVRIQSEYSPQAIRSVED